MDFKETKIKQSYILATTDRGFEMRYPLIPKADITYHNPDNYAFGIPVSENGKEAKPTQFRMKCNFGITPQMCDRLNETKLIVVTGYSNRVDKRDEKYNYRSHIDFEVKQMFDYDKFEHILYEFSVRFDMQSDLRINAEQKPIIEE